MLSLDRPAPAGASGPPWPERGRSSEADDPLPDRVAARSDGGASARDEVDVAAVVVTFNRCGLLAELIVSLLRQTCPLRAIYIIDNASVDGTEAYGRRVAAEQPNVKYLRSPTNRGGSGGFSDGVRAAHAAGHRWLWLMDDDVRALPDGLAGLVPYLSRGGCIHGRRWDFNGKPFFWQARFCERLAMPLPVPGNVFRRGPEFRTNVGVFEGMLIARTVVDRIGLPDSRFFITWDDAIYGWLASKVTRVLYVNHFALERRRRQRQLNVGFRHFNDASDLYRFHTVRNRPLVKEYVRREGVYSPFWFGVGSALVVCKEAARLLLVQHEVGGFKALWRGWRAGRTSVPRLNRATSTTHSHGG